jgi:D-threonate/D-erythronate kinase
MTEWLIIADDLTGAADCASPFAGRGFDAVVSLGGINCEASVLSVDADSRHLPAKAAAARQVAAQTAHWQPGMRLYKKIDSTLRGQPAAELAAQLSAWGAGSRQPAPLAIVAPAFPATGRVTLDGRMLLHELPLDQTPLWAREHTYADASLPDVLASAGLVADTITLEVIRAGCDLVLTRMKDAQRRGIAAVVCDGASDADLEIVAAASLQLGDAVWVGSAGLASALAATVAAKKPPHPPMRVPGGPVLVVVGSFADVTRRQARALTETQMVTPVPVRPETLLAGGQAPGWQAAVKTLLDGLEAGENMLLQIESSKIPDLVHGAELAPKLADMVELVSARIGAIVVTGGEIARAVLSRLGIQGIRLIDEVERGVPLGLSLGVLRIPIITKAGAFGDSATLCRCLARLGDLNAARVAQ